MIHDFEYFWATKRVVGTDCIKKVGPTLKADGAHVVMLHYGRGEYLNTTGLMDEVKKSLQDAGLSYVECGGVVPNPRVSLVRKGIRIAREENVDYILSLGGGSAVDSAKAISLGKEYDGDVWDLFVGKGNVADYSNIIPISAIVTYPATGAEAGLATVIRNEDVLEKWCAVHATLRPHYAFMDPQFTMTLPRNLLINGIADIMSHHTDRYMTDDAHFGVFDNLLESAMHYLHADLAPIILDPGKDNLVDRTELMAIADMGVDEFIAWGRHKENASHNIAHHIGALFDTLHGSTLSIIYCSWMRYTYKGNVERVARWAEKVWGVEPNPENLEKVAEEGISRLEQWYIELGMPIKFSDIDLHPTEEEMDHMAEMAVSVSPNGCLGSLQKLYKEDVIQIYKNSL